MLSGSTSEIADTIRGYRDTYGVSYLIVQDKHAEAFSKVIADCADRLAPGLKRGGTTWN